MNDDQPLLAPVPEPGEEPAQEQPQIPAEAMVPPKLIMLRPHSINIEKNEDGSASIEMLITPFEVVGFTIPAGAVQEFLRVLTGGIEVARSMPRMDVPSGRGR